MTSELPRLEFLLEEISMKNVLQILLPKILPPGYEYESNYFLRPHEGKSDLQKSIPNKIKAFSNFPGPVIFIILHDQDSNDCIKLKNELTRLFKSERKFSYLIRIVCRELESWYLGTCRPSKRFILPLKPLNSKIKQNLGTRSGVMPTRNYLKLLELFQR